MMKKILIGILLSAGLSTTLFAQQEPMYTQYRTNLLTVNPAYAGSREALSMNMNIRSQWVGIKGAPNTQNFSIHSPLVTPNLAMGLNIMHDRIGPTSTSYVAGDISGRIKITENGYLSGGVKLGLTYFSAELTSLPTGDPNDQSFSEDFSKWLPNVGVGVFYNTPRFYAGLSVPKVVTNVLFSEVLNNGELFEAREKRHYFAMLGYLHPLSSSMKLRATSMMRLVDGAPNSLDLTASVIFNDKIWLGGYYRWKESIGFIVDYNFTPQLRVGYSYDFTLTELQNYNSGSHELSLTYDFVFEEDKKIRSPRYF